MGNIWIVTKREFASFFATPVAYVFIAIFLMLSGIFTFFIGSQGSGWVRPVDYGI